jgi:hypothetical protein
MKLTSLHVGLLPSTLQHFVVQNCSLIDELVLDDVLYHGHAILTQLLKGGKRGCEATKWPHV